MAKPATSFTFATSVNYSVGPFTGDPTKVVPGDIPNGLVPGNGVPAGWLNYLFAIAGDWTVWLLAGSDAPDLDAHLVETNSNGEGSLAQLSLGGTAASLQALIVTQNTGAQSSSIFVTNTGTGTAVLASAVGAVSAIKGTNTGTGAGVEGVASGTNNVGVKGTGVGSGSGGEFTGGATGPGATCTGGVSGDFGVLATGTGTSAGVSATGGSLAPSAILGTASALVSQTGVLGVSNAAGTTTGAGVKGEGQGSAVGTWGSSTDGYGVVAQSDTTSPVRSAFRVVPQNADPSTPAMGDVMHRSDLDIQRVYTDSLWQSPWTTPGGHTHGLAAPTTVNVTNASVITYATLVQTTLAGPYEPRFAGGSVLIFASARFGDTLSSAHHYFIDVRIIDVTAGGVTVYDELVCTGPANIDGTVDGDAISQWTISVPYTVPTAGSRVFELQFKPNNGGIGSSVVGNVASLNIIGVFG
jgi:hypothetical protein